MKKVKTLKIQIRNNIDGSLIAGPSKGSHSSSWCIAWYETLPDKEKQNFDLLISYEGAA